MALVTIFTLGPNALMALIGHIRGARAVRPPDQEAVRELDVDVVIPAYNEAANIGLCLASVMRQTLKPNSITVIDDGSRDATADIAEAFAAVNNLPVRVIRRRRSIGKTPGLKIESRNLEGDVEFILDADTVLVSEDYIEKVVAQLYRVPGIAAVSGVVYPMREADRKTVLEFDSMQRLQEQRPDLDVDPPRSLLGRIAKGVAGFYRDAIFQFIQLFFYAGLQDLLGSIPNPVGCAVAYRRQYLKEFFDHYEPLMGDNMTTSEDIFLGTAFMAYGYHCSQVQDVIMRCDDPAVHQIPRQQLKWSSAWLQTAYHLPDMILSPFKFLKRRRHGRRNAAAAQKRVIVDGYRQPFGLNFVKQLGRPTGWIISIGLLEKIAFFIILLIMVVAEQWRLLLLTIGLETLLFTMILIIFSPERRLEYAIKGITATPFRYSVMVTEAVVLSRFVFDLVMARRGWRK